MSDSREITARQEGGGAIAPASQSANIVLMVMEASRDPAIDASKVKTMADLAMQLQDRERQSEFNRALNAAIMEMPTITKAGQIEIPGKDGKPGRIQGRFAKFEDIDRVVRPILQKHNLAIRFEIDSDGPLVAVRPIISHTNGFVERGGAMKVPLETSGSKNNVQGAGSSVSYAKRYTLCAALNIITEGVDDDGTGRGQVNLPHEREQTVLEGAQAAFEAGTYQAFFNAQSPKDRAYLIQTGKHQEFGGVVPASLPGSGGSSNKQPQADGKKTPAAGKPATDDLTPEQRRAKAEAWLSRYAARISAARDHDELFEVTEWGTNGVEQLKADFHDLYLEAERYVTERRTEINRADLL